MTEEIIKILLDHVIEIAFAIMGMFVTAYVVPWLKEKKLYDTVKIAVQAAEKWAQSHDIDKREWVEEQLTARGITVTPLISGMIESAVTELDAAFSKGKKTANTK
ncbi:MAG: hypothetical protein IJZ89_07450 [Clostridia bacterium]|nr:hypothetical protein [Clostridia bacterium]